MRSFFVYLGKEKHTVLIVLYLFFISCLGLMLRSYKLLDFPPSLFIDEYNLGLPAMQILSGTYTVPWYGIGWYGVPAAHLYYIAGILSLLGKNEWALRMAWVIPASLTIPAAYFFLRTKFNTRTALIASFILALSPVHIHLSRWAHGAIITPFAFFAALAAYSVLKSTSSKTFRFILSVFCGVLLAMMVYTYLGGRVLFCVFWIYVLSDTLFETQRNSKGRGKNNVPLYLSLIIIGSTALLILTPFLNYGISHSVEFWGRTDQASIMNKSASIQSNIFSLSQNILLYARMFWDQPDPNSRHTVFIGEPVFGYWTSALLFLGVVLYGVRKKARSVPILILFLGTLIGGILTTEAPSIFRSAAVIPLVCGFAAYILSEAFQYRKYLGLCVIGITLIVMGNALARMMKIVADPASDYYNAFTYRDTAIAETAYSYAQKGYHVYLYPDFFYFSSVKFENAKDLVSSKKPYSLFDVGDEQNIHESNTVLIVEYPFVTMSDYYKTVWPEVKITVRDEHNMSPFLVIEPRLQVKTSNTALPARLGLTETWYTDETKSIFITSNTVPTLYTIWQEDYPRSDASYAEWSGQLVVPKTDVYTFSGEADDAGSMRIYRDDRKKDVEAILSVPLSARFEASIVLQEGVSYRVEMSYKNLGGAKRYLLKVKSSQTEYGILDPLWLKPLP